jgi:triosephosphate isomerase (TIM)
MCAQLRERLGKRYGPELAASIRILYGGSVKASNAADLLAAPNIDGALVGGASLDATDFAQICQAALAAGGSDTSTSG